MLLPNDMIPGTNQPKPVLIDWSQSQMLAGLTREQREKDFISLNNVRIQLQERIDRENRILSKKRSRFFNDDD
jgi:hypothetical protein